MPVISALSTRHAFLIFSLIFAVSGFAGLIYESVWTHYLKLFLGHSAYAQVLVLAIFMAGLALGSWLASRISQRLHRLLLAYAVMEILIGLFALIFHASFTHIIAVAYDSIIPALASPFAIVLFKWFLAAALILPQSILLGTTFPLMTAGLIRRFPQRAGYALAMLYFANSLGAAMGILISGFFLIEAFGLPGTIIIAGVLNLLVALAVMLFVGWQADPQANTDTETTQSIVAKPIIKDTQTVNLRRGFLLAAFLTGAASFLYEVGWIRMLSLVLGSSTHAFELMLGAFILGLALGGLVIRRQIDRIARPVLVLGLIQIGMGCLALLTLVFYDQTFNVMQFAVNSLSDTRDGYILFNLFSNGIALMIMLPATILAGMTLPLMTHFLIVRGAGEQAIGHIYSSNTIGAIIGVSLGLVWLMPSFGVKSLIVVGGLVDVLLGLGFLLWASRQHEWQWQPLRHALPAILIAACVVFTVFFVQLDPVRMASGVYLHGKIKTGREMIYHADGRTATIDVFRQGDNQAIVTNGKIDAAIASDDLTKDEPTMTLLAALPLAIHPKAQNIAVIGMGSGMSSHTALGSPHVKRVDTIEIEPAMIEGAKLFGERVSRVFNDPRSHIHIEDAKAFFTHRNSRYDIIISEPSNPWVSGIAGLFSEQFYQHASRHLHEDGVFVQWLHIYSIDVDLVASVIKALSQHFDDYAIYALNDTDLAIVARNNGTVPQPKDDVFAMPLLTKDLAHIGMYHVDDFTHRYMGSRRALQPYFASFPLRANSDYYPVLDLGAVRTRFLVKNARELHRFRLFDAPLLEVLEGRSAPTKPSRLSRNFHLNTARDARQAIALYQTLAGKPETLWLAPDTLRLLRELQGFQHQCNAEQINQVGLRSIHQLARLTLPWLSVNELKVVWSRLQQLPCYAALNNKTRRWIALYAALGQRQFNEVSVQANAMLGTTGSIHKKKHYLLTIALLAAIDNKELDAAKQLWQRYEDKETRVVELRVLRAYLTAY